MGYLPSRKAAEAIGVHPNTLRAWADTGKIKYIRTASGQRRYDVDGYIRENKAVTTICYCRVSDHEQKNDLRMQEEYMQVEYPGAEIVKDIGSGLNFKNILDRAIAGDRLRVIFAHKEKSYQAVTDLARWIIERSGGEILDCDVAKVKK